MSKLTRDLTKALQKASDKKTTALDSKATVTRIEGNTAWVHLPGGVDETPVQRTIDCEIGDSVQVRIGGGRAWLTGNGTAPPTDNKQAFRAQEMATRAQTDIDEQKEYFWSDGDGAHVQGKTSGYRTDLKSDGMHIIKMSNGNEVAKFGTETVISTDDGTELAHFGYAPGTDSGGGTATAPYYTLGTRADSSTVGNYSTAEGYNTTASGYVSHAEGAGTIAEGMTSHAEGDHTKAIGKNSHAEGTLSQAKEESSHAEGTGTIADGEAAHAEGGSTWAKGRASHAEGVSTKAVGNYSHAEGYSTAVYGDYSHTEGCGTNANGDYSHAQNYYTTAGYQSQTAMGEYNDNKSTNLLEVGNGTSDNARSNAFEVSKTGVANAQTGITVGGYPIIETATATASTGSVAAGAYKNATITPTAPHGKSLIAVASLHITGTNTSYVQMIGFYINGNDIHVQFKNTYSSAVTASIEAIGIYI